MHRNILVLIVITMMVSTGIFSCTYDHAETVPCNGTLSDSVSFKNDIIPLFNTHCNESGCHSGTNPEGGLNLEPAVAYTELHKPGKGYINTAKPEFSGLYIQMNSVSSPMPPTGNLDDCTLELVLQWIEEGAKDN